MINIGCLMATLFALANASIEKPKELSILTLIPITGKEPADGRACAAGMQIAANAVNSRKDLLPGYFLKLQFEDEARASTAAGRAFINYIDNFSLSNETSSKQVFMSPVVVGPSIGCQNLVLMLKSHSFLEFSQYCNGPYLMDRKYLYSNLYRVQSPSYSFVAVLMLTLRKIGMWKQFALLTFALNANEYEVANTFRRHALRNDLEVIYYASEAEITPAVVQAVKDSGARVSVLILSQPLHCLQFLCYAYKVGMKAPYFAFLSLFTCFVPPDTATTILTSLGCNRKIYEEQLEVMFWIGPPASATKSYGITTFGYDLDRFEMDIGKALNGEKVPDYEQRHICHDSMLAAIATLVKAESVLQSSFNFTLSDFQDPARKKRVAKVVNETASHLDVNGLRIGPLKYSDHGEVEEPVLIAKWVGGQFRSYYTASPRSQNWGNEYNLSNYQLTALDKLTWPTKTGRPPKDLSQIEHRITTFPKPAYAVIVGLSALTALAQSGAFLTTLIKRKSKKFLVRSLLLLMGCLLLDTSAIIVTTGATQVSCTLLPVLTSMGLLIVNSNIFIRIFSFHMQWHKTGTENNTRKNGTARSSQRRARSVASAHSGSVSSIKPIDDRIFENYVITGTFVVAIIVGIVLTIWLAVIDPYQPIYDVSAVSFDETHNEYYDTRYEYCSCEYISYWIGSLLAGQSFLLLTGGFLGIHLRHVPLDMTECMASRVAAGNAIVILLATLVIITIVSSTGSHSQLIVFAIGKIVYSATNSLILYVPLRMS